MNGSIRGTIGPTHVVMGLTEGEAGKVWGQYFYSTARLDIDLQGDWRDGVLSLESHGTQDKLILRRNGTGFLGDLETAKHAHFNVSLAPAMAAPDAPADVPPKATLYERLQISGLRLVPVKSVAINGRPVRWYREPLTGLSLFRVEGGYPPAVLAALNHGLARNHWTAISSALHCSDEGKAGMEYSPVDSIWLSPDYVSFIWRASWYCEGNAHPDHAASGTTYDAHSGRELSLDALLYFGTRPIPQEDSDAWLEYRDKRFAPGVVALMKRYHPREMRPAGDGDENCDYTDPDVWNFPSWAVSAKGLWLGAYFARALRPCDSPDWAVIPWTALPKRH